MNIRRFIPFGTSASATARQASLIAAVLLLGPAIRLPAQHEPPAVTLDPIAVTATRTPAPHSALGSSVDFISSEELARRQVSSLRDALGGVPGAPLFASGADGAVASLFLRGANSKQTLFLVDGIRLNDPNTDYNVFLGGACVSACDSIEVAHGPQSTLYGGEAVGGVVALRARKGEGAPASRVAVEAGSFDTVQGAFSAQGVRGATAWNLALQGGRTDNDRPNNDFTSANYTIRLDRSVSDRLALGGTLRGFLGEYGSPGTRFTNDPDNEEREQNNLATFFAEYGISPAWSGRLVLGGQSRRFVSENPGLFGTQVTVVKNRRGVLDWQNTFEAGAKHRLTAGVTAEANHTRNTGFGDINERQTLLAFFAQDEWTPANNLHFTAGLRSDDHDTFGRATTGRATAAWLPASGPVKLRASYGTAFRSPGFLDLYGRSAFYRGNPDLKAEKARGWDAGVDVYLPEGRGVLGVTWFDTRLRDLIVFDFGVFPGTTANVERARTHGVEFSAQGRLPGGIESRLSYTWLEADNLTTGQRLLRRPRHGASADLWRDFGGGFSAGAGAVWVAQREDVHAANFSTIDAEDYAVARLYAAWAVNDRVTLKVRVENLFDQQYEEVHGYPALGRGVFAGVEAKF